MYDNNIIIKKSNAEFYQYLLLTVFILFSLYFTASSYKLSHTQIHTLKAVTGKVASVLYQKAKGKQAKPEVWVDLGLSGKFRVAYGNNTILQALTKEIKTNDVVTVYLKKPQDFYINLGKDFDILQLEKNSHVLYSLDIPQKSFHEYYILSAIMSFVLPLGCIFYWIKSKSNAMLERLQSSQYQPRQLSTE